MSRVKFVKVDQRNKAQHLCQLTEQYYQQGKKVLLVVQDDNQAVALDRFLWTWNKGSFLPHSFDNGSVDCLREPIVVATRESNPNNAPVLIMGTPCSLAFVERFELAIDFAETYDPLLLEQSRERFREYRNHGLNPQML